MSEQRPTARDLVRRRRGDYRAPETGRHHHIGAAPDVQPVLGEEGDGATTGTAAVQLAQRTLAQLRQARTSYAERMAAASEGLEFEQAARLRDAVAAVDAELQRRGATPS